jgi:kynurenine formamidase
VVRVTPGAPNPAYDELPELSGLGVRHAWAVWGAADRLGTLNLVTESSVLTALATPRLGRRISLCLPLGAIDPPLYGRTPFAHRVFDRNRNMVEDEIERLDPQGASQWDSLRHIRAGRHGHYGGLGADDIAVAELGVGTMVRFGLVLRGVLLDLPAFWLAKGRSVDPFGSHSVHADELQACADHQRLARRPGDLLLVRTGWLTAYRNRGLADSLRDMPTSSGLDAAESMARYLWDGAFCAVAADNPAVEVLPGDPAVGSLHRRLIPALGMPLGELWDLDELAAHCAASKRYELCVVSAPLHVPGGVASPANAIAIV